MKQIRYKDISKIDKYWIFYRDVEMGERHVDLEACANSFERTTGILPEEGGMRCVGYRTREGRTGIYELFTIGHMEVRCGAGLFGLLRRDSEAWLSFEKELNSHGWKTIEK